jgi:hypothetical protein
LQGPAAERGTLLKARTYLVLYITLFLVHCNRKYCIAQNRNILNSREFSAPREIRGDYAFGLAASITILAAL